MFSIKKKIKKIYIYFPRKIQLSYIILTLCTLLVKVLDQVDKT